MIAAKSLAELEVTAQQLAEVAAAESEVFDAIREPRSRQSANASLSLMLSDLESAGVWDREPNECRIVPTKTAHLAAEKHRIYSLAAEYGVVETTSAAKEYAKIGFVWGKELLPPEPPDPERKNHRAAHGEFLERSGTRGPHRLVIISHSDQDAVVTVARKDPGSPLASIYVRAGASATVKGLPASTYRVFVKTGANWDGGRGDFTRDCSYVRFTEKFGPPLDWQIYVLDFWGKDVAETEPF
ncbi:hypothetical protein [Microlunatus sp. GCM10028923]|uniref:hypothetical protein n=1 Tax=Microlunatus sp. GCM10028923 TaxID=3273400 RepID=UPI00362173D8